MYNKGLVSIIVPCYNGEQYIGRFFASLLQQEDSNIQFIIVNDGSKDSSEAVIFEYQNTLVEAGIRLEYIKKENGGIGSAIQTGLMAVKGEYLVWFNIDDILLPNTISEMKRFLDDNPDYGVVRPDVYISNESDPYKALYCINDNNPEKAKPQQFENAVNEHNFTFGCSMIRMELFDRINPTRWIYQSREGQNWQLLLPMFYYYKSGYIDKPLYFVVEQEESTSRVKDQNKRILQLFEYERILIETISFMNIIEKERYIESIRIRYAHKLFSCCERCDYDVMRQKYNLLNNAKQLEKAEKRKYRKRFFQIDYWVYLKHKIMSD